MFFIVNPTFSVDKSASDRSGTPQQSGLLSGGRGV